VKKIIAVFAVIGFAATLGIGSAFAEDFVTACVKEKKSGEAKKNTKFKRVALGTSPGSSCGKKEAEVTMVTDQLAASLQAQITANANNIANNTAAIGQNSSDIADNADMIANLKAGLISSMIGGGHNSSVDGADTFYMPLYNWFRGSSDEEVASKVAVTGWLTKLVVIQNEATGALAAQTYRYMVNGVAVDLSPLVADNFCATSGDSGDESTMCQSEGCYKINMGDTLSVRVIAANGGGVPNVSPTRWTGRFVETDADCPLLEP
jgi:hypothetical protein